MKFFGGCGCLGDEYGNFRSTTLQRVRKQTDDESKTNESFEIYREKTKIETDKAVLANRLEADKAVFNDDLMQILVAAKDANITGKKDHHANNVLLRDERFRRYGD